MGAAGGTSNPPPNGLNSKSKGPIECFPWHWKLILRFMRSYWIYFYITNNFEMCFLTVCSTNHFGIEILFLPRGRFSPTDPLIRLLLLLAPVLKFPILLTSLVVVWFHGQQHLGIKYEYIYPFIKKLVCISTYLTSYLKIHFSINPSLVD